MADDETFAERMEKWQAEAPVRAAQRAARSRSGRAADKAIGLGALLLVLLIAIAVVALIVLLGVAFIGSGAYKPIVGFAIAATVIAAISIGIRPSS
jgi:uncharacterized membrane protein